MRVQIEFFNNWPNIENCNAQICSFSSSYKKQRYILTMMFRILAEPMKSFSK